MTDVLSADAFVSFVHKCKWQLCSSADRFAVLWTGKLAAEKSTCVSCQQEHPTKKKKKKCYSIKAMENPKIHQKSDTSLSEKYFTIQSFDQMH